MKYDPDLTKFQKEKIEWVTNFVLDPRTVQGVPPALAKKHMKSHYSKAGEPDSDEGKAPGELARFLAVT